MLKYFNLKKYNLFLLKVQTKLKKNIFPDNKNTLQVV
jgi:hypothetical protein